MPFNPFTRRVFPYGNIKLARFPLEKNVMILAGSIRVDLLLVWFCYVGEAGELSRRNRAFFFLNCFKGFVWQISENLSL